jgi:electron transport complex protein RnfA
MTDYLLLFVGTVLVNNFVLVKFLGLCPFMGVSKSWKRQWVWGWRRPSS